MIKLKKITLTSREGIEVAEGLTIIVGPNNAGKSRLLSELQTSLTRYPGRQVGPILVVAQHELEFNGTSTEFLASGELDRYLRPPGQYDDGYQPHDTFKLPTGGAMPKTQVDQFWGSQDGLGPLAGYFSLLLDAGNRLGMVGNQGTYNTLTQMPSNPVQQVYADEKMAQAVSDLMRRAFGEPLTVNRYGGSLISLHVGKVAGIPPAPPAPPEYLQELAALPVLQEQGDGVRAFVGMLLTIAAARYPLVLIDEPEAFLHPPQARLLGRVLAEQHDRGTQFVVATHSADILEGITTAKASSDKVSVVRLTRRGKANRAAQIKPSTVGDLFNDPLMRYYSILDGLFSQGVVLCEGDSDCTYYRAVLDSLDSLPDGTPVSSVSVHFAHCGGKARIARAVRALQAARVPVLSVLDIDFLQNEYEFTELVGACGGDAASLAGRRNVVMNAVQAKSTKIDRVVAKARIGALLDKGNAAEVSSADCVRIRDVVTPKTGWGQFKVIGRTLLQGGSRAAFDELDAALKALGIYMVTIGELESFHGDISRDDKAAWLSRVLGDELYKSSSESSKFVESLVSRDSDQFTSDCC